MTQGRPPSGPPKAVIDKKHGKAILVLAAQVSTRRTDLGLTQQQLSEQAGISRDGAHRIEKASIDPKLTVIEAVAEALGTTLSELLK